MKKISTILVCSMAVALAFTAACVDEESGGVAGDGDGDSAGTGGGDGDGDGDGDMGGNPGDGDGDMGGGAGDGDGDGDGTGGTDPVDDGLPFTTADCIAEGGPNSEVTGSDIGAFTGDADWMEGWTNWNEHSTPEDNGDDADITVTEDIATDTTWTANNIYALGANVHVLDGATLTIEAGTLIKSGGSAASLIVSRGGMLMAEGTKADPIVFTSDAVNGSKDQGQWGGVVILGKAVNWKGVETQVEGLPADPLNQYGGADDTDNSGTLTYVRIEFGGTEIADGNEINGLTMGSVGSGTTINHVMVSTTLDDGFEWFGGTVKADHLIVNDEGDDMFDVDTGYRGELSVLFGRQLSPVKEDPNGLEWDGSLKDTDSPLTDFTASKITLCGNGLLGNPNYGAVLRERVRAVVDDVAIAGFDAAFDIRDDAGTQENPYVVFTNTKSWGHVDGLVDPGTVGTFDTQAWFDAAEGNEELEPTN